MSATATLPLDGRRARPALVIDGTATLVSRKATEGRIDPSPRTAANDMPVARRPEAKAAPFRSAAAGRQRSAPDLVFQGETWTAPRPTSASLSATSARHGLSLFTDAGRPGRPVERRMAWLAAGLAAVVLPVLVLSSPFAPLAATRAPAAADQLVIDQIATSIVPRGAGAVLTVDVRIRNVSREVAVVPPVRIALAEGDGGRRSKALIPGVATLSAGRSVRFHSTVAVAKDTRGAIEVGFMTPRAPSGPPALSGKTLTE